MIFLNKVLLKPLKWYNNWEKEETLCTGSAIWDSI